MINELIIAGAAFFHPPVVLDSIGTETINGKVFVLHQVGEKETLYAVSRRYGVPVEVIVQFNPTASDGLDIGQVLKVPYTPKRTAKAADASLHVVAAKETMFSISQAYGISIDDIKQWNNLTSNALSVGQELIVKKPSGASRTTAVAAGASAPAAKAGAGLHVVAPKETMYSISRQYGISTQDLKDWNKIEGDEISIGQELIVVAPKAGQTTTVSSTTPASTPSAKPNGATVTTTTATGTAARKPDDGTVGTEGKSTITADSRKEPVVNPPVKPEPKDQTIRISESVKSSDEVLETGLAELIEGTDGNRKYLALHRTAPVGTILKVKNEMNNREVFVRVMGKMPDTALTNKLVIKISKSAFDRLGAIDPRFRVEVTYFK
ncbi:MAG TPA: LysM peptidoglycan-binding domain-containing protein [Chryseolinea sp.]|nr:LysM peptidoglycan-binding domain-containing protein [Chryseolinea sp.]